MHPSNLEPLVQKASALQGTNTWRVSNWHKEEEPKREEQPEWQPSLGLPFTWPCSHPPPAVSFPKGQWTPGPRDSLEPLFAKTLGPGTLGLFFTQIAQALLQGPAWASSSGCPFKSRLLDPRGGQGAGIWWWMG
jgi:hypothetical protein